jgi:hypothetical protein
MSQLRRLVARIPLWWPGFNPGQIMWDMWWTERHWGRFTPSNSVSSATHSFQFKNLSFTFLPTGCMYCLVPTRFLHIYFQLSDLSYTKIEWNITLGKFQRIIFTLQLSSINISKKYSTLYPSHKYQPHKEVSVKLKHWDSLDIFINGYILATDFSSFNTASYVKYHTFHSTFGSNWEYQQINIYMLEGSKLILLRRIYLWIICELRVDQSV